ncbi:hypothetical protein STAFG_0361 [Streptomyces afghaniensis 772]|uniref:Uncharacterized protein n=1 Tax=Streptomyces afghaniensis 772 TaxID=1283301 RepID=S4MZB3_9ACTN|nr:hypothetical protein STAFG_0361 [Streptomyces afghaniensis 772]
MPEGQPFLIRPVGMYDVESNRYFLGVVGVVAVEHTGRARPGSAFRGAGRTFPGRRDGG